MQLVMARWKIRNGLWTGLDWFFRGVISFFFEGGGFVLFFLVCKKIAFPQKAIFFHLGGGGEGKDLTFLLVCVLVLDWALCLTHGRHVSLES